MPTESPDKVLQSGPIYNLQPQADSIVHVAAMHAACAIYDQKNQRLSDFSCSHKKEKFVFTSVIANENSPDWVNDRALLWNRIEQLASTMPPKTMTAYEIKLSYPQGLSTTDMIELAKQFVASDILPLDFIADTFVHLSKPYDPHMHVLMPMLVMQDQTFVQIARPEFTQKQIDLWLSNWQARRRLYTQLPA